MRGTSPWLKKKVVSKYLGREPDQLPVTERRAQHLSEISGVDVHKITGKKIADVHKLLKWKIDSKLHSVIAESCDDGTDCDLKEFLASSSITIDDLAVLASTYTGRNFHGN